MTCTSTQMHVHRYCMVWSADEVCDMTCIHLLENELYIMYLCLFFSLFFSLSVDALSVYADFKCFPISATTFSRSV